MSATEWAAWVGASTGVAALAWEIVRWSREGPRLLVRASPNMTVVPDTDGRYVLMVYVTNRGTMPTTLTGWGLFEFRSWNARRRMRPARNWVAMHDSEFGLPLPRELQPGQQWSGGVRQNADIGEIIAAERLYVGVYHAFEPTRPVLAHAKPFSVKESKQ